MAYEHLSHRQVQWVETDAAGIVHFSNFFRFMEQAEHAFFVSQGLSIHMDIGGCTYTFPRVHADADFISPLRFEDSVEMRTVVRQMRTRSIDFEFVISRILGESRVIAAIGSITTVCITRDAGGEMRATEIPTTVRDKISPAPPQVLAELEELQRRKKG